MLNRNANLCNFHNMKVVLLKYWQNGVENILKDMAVTLSHLRKLGCHFVVLNYVKRHGSPSPKHGESPLS